MGRRVEEYNVGAFILLARASIKVQRLKLSHPFRLVISMHVRGD